jgi:hypothetical protein
MQLKLGGRAWAIGKDNFQVSDSLEDRIRVRACRRLLLSAEAGPQPVQVVAELPAHQIKSLQRKGQAELFDCCFDRASAQQLQEPGPQSAGPKSVPRQHLGNEDAKAATAAPALAPITAPDPLTALAATLRGQRIIALELAVAI